MEIEVREKLTKWENVITRLQKVFIATRNGKRGLLKVEKFMTEIRRNKMDDKFSKAFSDLTKRRGNMHDIIKKSIKVKLQVDNKGYQTLTAIMREIYQSGYRDALLDNNIDIKGRR